MADKTHLLCLKAPRLDIQHVIASSVEIHGEHLALLNSNGKLVALFCMKGVQSWNVLPNKESCDWEIVVQHNRCCRYLAYQRFEYAHKLAPSLAYTRGRGAGPPASNLNGIKGARPLIDLHSIPMNVGIDQPWHEYSAHDRWPRCQFFARDPSPL
jgi:hypothetical protein